MLGFLAGAGTGGGGISPAFGESWKIAKAPLDEEASGSLNTAILDAGAPPAADADATRFILPAWRSVVPPAFLTSGTFSLMRVLRVPMSGYGVGSSSPAMEDGEGEGSTNTWRRALGGARVVVVGTVNTSS